eukprot:3936133-Alexandrium_andersonii.AAC.1
MDIHANSSHLSVSRKQTTCHHAPLRALAPTSAHTHEFTWSHQHSPELLLCTRQRATSSRHTTAMH